MTPDDLQAKGEDGVCGADEKLKCMKFKDFGDNEPTVDGLDPVYKESIRTEYRTRLELCREFLCVDEHAVREGTDPAVRPHLGPVTPEGRGDGLDTQAKMRCEARQALGETVSGRVVQSAQSAKSAQAVRNGASSNDGSRGPSQSGPGGY